MAFVVGAAVISGLATLGGSLISSNSARKAREDANEQVNTQLTYQREQDDLLEAQRQRYREVEVTNQDAPRKQPWEGREDEEADGALQPKAGR